MGDAGTLTPTIVLCAAARLRTVWESLVVLISKPLGALTNTSDANVPRLEAVKPEMFNPAKPWFAAVTASITVLSS